MTELHDALRNLDRPTAPSARFAARLEDQWLAALDEADVASPSLLSPPSLGEPAQVVVLPVDRPRRGDRRRFNSRYALVAAAAVIALIAAGTVIVRREPSPVETPPPPTPAPTVAPTTVAPETTVPSTLPPTLPPASGTVTASHPFSGAEAAAGDAPKRITIGRDGVWVPLGQLRGAQLLDRGTLETVRSIDAGLTNVTDVIDAGGTVWFSGAGGVATLADGATAATLRPTLTSEFEWTIATSGTTLWAAQFGGVTVHRIDLGTGDETTFTVPAPVSWLAAGPSLVWIYSEAEGDAPTRITGFDVATNALMVTADVPLPVDAGVGSLLATDDGVWLAGGGAGAFVREIHNDGTAGVEVALPGDYADGMAVDGDGLWIAVRFGTAVYRIAAATGAITNQVKVLNRTADVAFDGGALFAASYQAPEVQRILPLG